MNKENWLCPNCIYSGNCLIEAKSPTPIYYCEEHFVKAKTETPPHEQIIRPIPFELANQEGLCVSCDHKNHCTWKTESHVVFSCEHYK